SGERDLFRLLLNHVTGVGPKIALSVLSGLPVEMFKSAVVAGDTGMISKISGVGKKTAERIVLELKDKVGVAAEWEASSAKNAPSPEDIRLHDAVLALISLGYKQAEAHKAVNAAIKSGAEAKTAEDLVRQALKILS
ncbi:MAG: Holliday junction branch migration protein RuvA, partial [Terrimicrobiaceae bacterium]